MRGFALYLPESMDFSWNSTRDYLRRYEDEGVALNVVQLIGHGTLRVAAMGFARRAPAAREQATMERLMDESMADGAAGLATGLIYAPGSYAATDEIVGIARRAGAARGFYASHIRGEGATLLDAVRGGYTDRAGGRATGAGEPYQGGGTRPLGARRGCAGAHRRRARGGLDVRADVYPYTASSTSLRTLMPDWVLEGGIEAMLGRLTDPASRARIRSEISGGAGILSRGIGWEDVMIAYAVARPDAQGRRVSEIAAARGWDPLDAAMDLLVDEGARGASSSFSWMKRISAGPSRTRR